MIIIVLPWPAKELNPNKRVHWAVKHKAAKEARYIGKINALTSPSAPPNLILLKDQKITYIFHPPTKHIRDDDNFISAMKHFRAGVADAYNIDDSRFHTQPAEWGEVIKGGKVILELEEL